MTGKTVEFRVNCKRCGKPIGYSGMMYEKMKEFGHSRPEYCEDCRKILTAEKMTMGAAYYSLKTVPGTDISEAVPGELGKVFHPDRPHIKVEEDKKFDASKFGATPNKIVEIYEWLKHPSHQVVIIKGGTGSGKSTALPYWLIYPPEGVPKDFFTRDGQIVITQPRIVATTGVSKYLGTLLGASVGKGFDIGYRYSKDRNADKFNAAFMATDGSLINMIKMGQLADLSVVMIDEAHERSLNIDIILHLLKDQLPLYPHLKLLIVSATINAESFLEYFGRETATLVEFEPKSKFTYQVFYTEEKDKLNYDDPGRLKRQIVPALAKKVMWLLGEQVSGRKEKGHILAFLQGVKPIEEAVGAIRSAVASDEKMKNLVEVYPLYSALSEEETDKAISNETTEKIKVIVATNVAEASITVDGVVYVIESGIENQAQWEIEDTIKMIELRLISKANARQRWGRSGRTRNGEVFCLYTEKQFEAMLDFPIPAIQRSSMEEILLKLKELGIDEVEEGWIDAPVADELSRSVKSLKQSGAFDRDDMLTEYGALLSQFQYPADLANLVIMADRFGCAVEIATLLPIIKSGGFKSFLMRDTSWDEPTKQKVEKIQKTLWQGCRDDVEFIFRMYSFWRNPPEIPGSKGDARRNLAVRRQDWAKAFYVNFDVFEDGIEPERERVLRLLSSHRKDHSTRDLQFELLDRVRIILTFCVPFVAVKENEYSFNPRLEVPVGASSSCQLAVSAENAEMIMAVKKQNASPLKLAQVSSSLIGSPEPLDSVLKRLLTCPAVPVFDTEQFKAFATKYRVGDEVLVEVTGYAEHTGDFRISLTVKENTTGFETWLTPSDIGFTQSSAVVKQIPLGTKLRVVVRAVNQDKEFVRLSCLPLVEAKIENAYREMKRVDGQVVARAKVIDIRTDNKLVFIAELSKPAEGFVLVIHANEKFLSKPIGQYQIGEVCLVSFRLEAGFVFKANLNNLSPRVAEYIRRPNSRLSFGEGKLGFGGKMKNSDYVELAQIDSDAGYLAALDYLYLSSNMNWASRVNDAGWLGSVKDKYSMGELLSVTVKTVLSAGAIVSLADGQIGFINATDINPFRRVINPLEVLKPEQVFKAKIVGFNEERRQINLSLAILENSPLRRYRVGQTIDGVVDNLTDYGAFVSLGLGYSGLVHVSKMGRRVNKPGDLLSKGNKVKVEILEMKEEGGRVTISLLLKSIEKD